jgi:Tfp pilus assembly protein PilZ
MREDLDCPVRSLTCVSAFGTNANCGVRSEEGGMGLGRAPTEASRGPLHGVRQSPRVRCSGSVEFRVQGNNATLWGTVTDISLHGCYLDTKNTFSIGTDIFLVLKSFGIRIQSTGTVRTSYPSSGMGVAFTDIEPGQQQHLKQLIDVLTGHGSTPRNVPFHENVVEGAPGQVDPIAFLDEITEFFRKKPLLSREEFVSIANRVRRP